MPPVSQDPVRRVSFTIANGALVSTEPQDLLGHVVVGVITPEALTSTSLYVDQWVPNPDYPETGRWTPTYDSDGTEVAITVAADRFVAVNPTTLPYVGKVRVRVDSGEAAERTIQLVTRQLG